MGNVRVYVTIDQDMKDQLESLAKANYRALNGEIQMALDLYIRGALGFNALTPLNNSSETITPTIAKSDNKTNTLELVNDYDNDIEVDEF